MTSRKQTAVRLVILGIALPNLALAQQLAVPGMNISTHTHDRIAGDFDEAVVRVSFASRIEDDSRVVLHLQLGDALLEAEMNLEQRTAVVDGHGHALSADQLTALREFGAAYERNLDPDRREPLAHEDAFFRVISFWSWSPVGMPLKRYVVSGSHTEVADPVEFDEKSTERFPSGVGPMCGGGPEEFSFCDDDDCFQSEDTITYLSAGCACEFYELSHDMDGFFSHCYCTETQGSGCNLDPAFDCLGRCGDGCEGVLDCEMGGSNGAGIYTIDCAEHDRCAIHPGGVLNPFCQDEFVDTANDCLMGVQNCDGCAASPAPGLSAWGLLTMGGALLAAGLLAVGRARKA